MLLTNLGLFDFFNENVYITFYVAKGNHLYLHDL